MGRIKVNGKDEWNDILWEDKDLDPNQALWKDVLMAALVDIRGNQFNFKIIPEDQQAAIEWFNDDISTKDDIGSFAFCCDVLNLDKEYLLNKLKKEKILK